MQTISELLTFISSQSSILIDQWFSGLSVDRNNRDLLTEICFSLDHDKDMLAEVHRQVCSYECDPALQQEIDLLCQHQQIQLERLKAIISEVVEDGGDCLTGIRTDLETGCACLETIINGSGGHFEWDPVNKTIRAVNPFGNNPQCSGCWP